MHFDALLTPDRYQIFLFAGRATLPFGFACHPWLVVNDHGTLSRFEVFWHPRYSWPERWGYLHKDFYPPSVGISMLPFADRPTWGEGTVFGYIEGGEGSLAARMAACIKNSPHTYPYRDAYKLRGPNSNTYVGWVLEQFPEANLHLPWNAFGKSYRR